MDPYAQERELKHKEFLQEHSRKVKILDNLQVLHEVMNRYAELSHGWTRDSLVVEREMNVSKQEVLYRMEKKSSKGLLTILFISLVLNAILLYLLLFR